MIEKLACLSALLPTLDNVLKDSLFICPYQFVLILGGVELIFFIAASVGLCFGFVLKTVSITQRRSSYR